MSNQLQRAAKIERRFREAIRPVEEIVERTERLAVLCEPTRYQLALLLDVRAESQTELARLVFKERSVVSRHLKRMQGVGLLDHRDSKNWRLFYLSDEGRRLLRLVERHG